MINFGLSLKLGVAFQTFTKALTQAIKEVLTIEIEGDQHKTKELVGPGIPIKGKRLWLLLASCLIASIGLNTNSSAVIIGAMLISPLMGPILGLGFGMATASRRMIRSSIQNLLFAIFISLSVASVYFLISPFQDPTSEILSRTAPNLLDLLVAIAAAFAGVIAINSTSLAGAVPGVAIATAIMPPLCACAYGIAHGNWKIAIGAFYLFFVNAVAIAVVAFLIFKRMRFSQDTQESTENGNFRPAIVSVAILLVVAPLAWSLWGAWRDNFENRSVARLIQNYKSKLEIVSWQWNSANGRKLVLYNFKRASPEIRTKFENELRVISPNASLELHETSASPEMEELATQIKTSQLSALVSNPKIVEGLMKLASTETQSSNLMQELLEIESELSLLTGTKGQIRAYLRTADNETETLIEVKAKNRSEREQIRKNLSNYKDWLETKLSSKVTLRIEILP